MGGGEWMNQQQQAQHIPCPTCPEVNTTREFYKHLRELKKKPFKEKMDSSLQINGIIWGNTNIILIVLLIGAIFHKHILDYFKKNGFFGFQIKKVSKK